MFTYNLLLIKVTIMYGLKGNWSSSEAGERVSFLDYYNKLSKYQKKWEAWRRSKMEP